MLFLTRFSHFFLGFPDLLLHPKNHSIFYIFIPGFATFEAGHLRSKELETSLIKSKRGSVANFCLKYFFFWEYEGGGLFWQPSFEP